MRGQELRLKKGFLQFLLRFGCPLAALVALLLLCVPAAGENHSQSTCCGWESGFRSASRLSHAASAVVKGSGGTQSARLGSLLFFRRVCPAREIPSRTREMNLVLESC